MASRLVILLSLLHVSLQSEYVPVLVWGDKSINLKESFVGRTISESEFHNLYLDNLKNDYERSVILFAQKTLSTEDLAKYSDAYNEKSDGASFKHLKYRIQNGVSRQLISVENPFAAFFRFSSLNNYEIIRIESTKNLPELKDERVFLVVHLPEDAKKSDELINSVLKKFEQKNKNYIAIYTGETSSSINNAKRFGRHILAKESGAEEKPVVAKNFSCGLLTMTGKKLVVQNFNKEKPKVFEMKGMPSKDPTCDKKNKIVEFQVDFKNNTINVDLTLKFTGNYTNFKSSSSNFFNLKNYRLEGKYDDEDLDSNLTRVDYVAPGRSYHCRSFDVKFLIKKDQTVVKQITFTLVDFQVQIGKGLAKFAYPEDCVGFFTAPIWSGLIASSLLIGVLVFAVLMIMDIKVMDRFDDPKGKLLNLGKTEN